MAPASSFPREEVDAGVAELGRLGLEAVYDDSLFARIGSSPARPKPAPSAIHERVGGPGIAALIAMRGGYGSAQLLPLLIPALMRARKALIGYSDITALLCVLPAATA